MAPREHPAGPYDEALERLHGTGPEFDGWLSNHGPMVVEALARRGSAGAVHRWTDRYVRRLEEAPPAGRPVDDWRAALGDSTRLADWLELFRRAADEQPWEDLLRAWWPRLLPGIAAGATHGVIRVGHAVEALRAEATRPRRQELGQALGYWAARWQPVPVVRPAGTLPVADAVEDVPRVPVQDGGIRARLALLADVPDWERRLAAAAGPGAPQDVPRFLTDLVSAVVAAYPRIAVGEPTMLVHAATAPNAVRRTLPSLPVELWPAGADAAWSATAAVLAAYAPEPGRRVAPDVGRPDDAWSLAVADGGEHALKLADTALDVADAVGPDVVAQAVATAVALDA